MDGPKRYRRCPCSHCGGAVEYPAYAAGGMTMCPQCGKSTRAEDPGEAISSGPVVQKAAEFAAAATLSRPPRPSPVSTASPAAAPAQRPGKSRVPVLVLAACC